MSLGTKIMDVVLLLVLAIWGLSFLSAADGNPLLSPYLGEWQGTLSFLGFLAVLGWIGGRLVGSWKTS